MSDALRRSGLQRIVGVSLWVAAQVTVLFLAAGRIDLPRAWLFGVVLLASFLIGGLVVVHRSPEIVNQRGEKKPGTRWWDRLFIAGYVPLIFAIPLVAGLDVGRFHWSSMGTRSALLGVAMHILAGALLAWAMMTNPHFETMVRIQAERNHQVVSAGPYRFVRHPGYVAGILLSVSVPLIVGSLWALIPAGMIALLYVVRTALEDQTLRQELPGYDQYTTHTEHRLFPLIW
jgi:protein-S-isoprenylcysteine O-methyltransferase Ste14